MKLNRLRKLAGIEKQLVEVDLDASGQPDEALDSSGSRSLLWRDAVKATATRLSRALDGKPVPNNVIQGAAIALAATYKMQSKKMGNLIRIAIRKEHEDPHAGTGDPSDPDAGEPESGKMSTDSQNVRSLIDAGR